VQAGALNSAVSVHQVLLEKPASTRKLNGVPIAGHDAVRRMLLQSDVFSLLTPPIRFVLIQWNISWGAKGHLEPPSRRAGGEEERVSERIKVRGGVGKAYEGAVDELDFDVSLSSDPDVTPRTNRLGDERCYLVLVGGEVVSTGAFGVWTNGSSRTTFGTLSRKRTPCAAVASI